MNYEKINNEDLVEAIALAHDLGHTPFGHAGQDVLNECMQSHGGFEHNLQSLRVVDQLEEQYPLFDGINLSFETREGILKHCSAANAQALEAREPNGVATRFIDNTRPSLEAQLCNLTDEIAYNSHDMDDGVRSGLINMAQLLQVPLFAQHHDLALQQYPGLATAHNQRRLLYETIRRMLSAQVYDLIAHSSAAIEQAAPASVDAVRRLPPLLAFSHGMREQSRELKRFLFANLYRHPQVHQTRIMATRIVRELFAAYLAQPQEIPAGFGLDLDGATLPSETPQRKVADYIAGMTDRFAVSEHERLTGERLLGSLVGLGEAGGR